MEGCTVKQAVDTKVTIRIPTDLRDELIARAAERGTTLSDIIRDCVDLGLANVSKRPGRNRTRTWVGPVRLAQSVGGCILHIPDASLVREDVAVGDWVWIALEGSTKDVAQ